MNEVLRWEFPLLRTRTGMLQGNGIMGAMIWGEENVLKITLNRSDFWDHRGGVEYPDTINFNSIRAHLEKKEYQKLAALFEQKDAKAGEPRLPTLLPMGRIDVCLQKENILRTGYVHFKNGKVAIDVANGQGAPYQLAFYMAIDKPLINIHFPPNMDPPVVNRVPSFDLVGQVMEGIGFEKPELFNEETMGGWVQKRPADPAMCCAYSLTQSDLWITSVYGETPEKAKKAARKMLDDVRLEGHDAIRQASARWWGDYWKKVPDIDVPNESISFIYYGMYKFAGLTNPNGVPSGHQGPWIEEYRMPPGRGDYNFNINVPMCYWPAYRANLLDHLNPLFSMIRSWMPKLKENAHRFVGIENGVIVPYASDDRGTGMERVWAQIIDQGRTAWVAEMMYRYFLYTHDIEFLRTTAYPFMAGTIHAYEKMLDNKGKTYTLPVSVSPEYREDSPNAWGRNASFQLACIHYLCERLIEASAILKVEPDPLWDALKKGLPEAAFYNTGGDNGEKVSEIGVWDSVPLEESHCHHSHLAGIFPFDTLNIDNEEWRAVVEKSLTTWVAKGMGKWTGWCVPWASAIHTRVRNADMAELLLEIWNRVFTNEGNGTLHDPQFPGFGVLASGATKVVQHQSLQMDAGMAAAAAVMEMMVHTRRGVNYLFWGAPNRWRTVSFTNVRTEGGFEISASRRGGHVQKVIVKANFPGTLRLHNPWTSKVACQRHGGSSPLQGELLEIQLAEDERVELSGE